MLAAALSTAIAAAVAAQRLGDGCTPGQVRQAVATADTRRIGRIGSDDVVLVALESSCMCGSANCPWLVVRPGARQPVLLSTYAFAVDVVAGNEALPRLREHAHNSALVTDETLDAFRGGAYVAVRAERVRGDTGARKPDTIPIRFAAGASSAPLRGRVSLGWYDAYAFDAAAGQHLMLTGANGKALELTLFAPANGAIVELRAGNAVVLPRAGTYRLHVEGRDERETPYALTLAIR
jgi:hypothetical protein